MATHPVYRAAAGVSSDFERLLKKFISTSTVRYEDFAKVWREMKMSYIYAGRSLGKELKEFIEECMAIAVKLFLPPYQFETRVCGLYILYALYNTQPFIPKVKIRVTLEQWTEMLAFHSVVKSQNHYDINFIFVRLRLDGAFIFVAVPTELYPRLVDHQDEMPPVEVGKPLDVLPSDTTEQMRAVHDQYWKMKCALAGTDSHAPDPALDVIESNILEEVAKTIKEYEEHAKHRLDDQVSGKAKCVKAAKACDVGSDSDGGSQRQRGATGKGKVKPTDASANVGHARGGEAGAGDRSLTSAATSQAASAGRIGMGVASSGSNKRVHMSKGGSKAVDKSFKSADSGRTVDGSGDDSSPAAHRGKEQTSVSRRESDQKRDRKRMRLGKRRKCKEDEEEDLDSDSDSESYSVHDSSTSDSDWDGKRKTKRATGPSVRGRPPTVGLPKMSPKLSGKPADSRGEAVDVADDPAQAAGRQPAEVAGTDDPTICLDMPQI